MSQDHIAHKSNTIYLTATDGWKFNGNVWLQCGDRLEKETPPSCICSYFNSTYHKPAHSDEATDMIYLILHSLYRVFWGWFIDWPIMKENYWLLWIVIHLYGYVIPWCLYMEAVSELCQRTLELWWDPLKWISCFLLINKPTVTAITGNIFGHKDAGRDRFDTYTKWHDS